MQILEVRDIGIEEIIESSYDIAIFSCGYETRSTALSHKLDSSNITETLTLYFIEHKDLHDRQKNEHHFRSFSKEHIEVKFDEEEQIYNWLNSFLEKNKPRAIKILIDYSSMSRLFYVTLLNWAKYIDIDYLCIDFVYSVGKYVEDLEPLVITKILAIPGHEGVTTHAQTISIFGLGFDSLSTLCVLDKLEPSKIFSFIAIPINDEYKNKTQEINTEFLENYSEPPLEFPLTSIEKAYRLMSELISPFRNKYNISFIPMGPKPLVLATVLLSTKFRDVINLYVKGTRKDPPNVLPFGKFICTKVTFEK